MQKVSLRKNRYGITHPCQNSATIVHFSLEDSLPTGHILALNNAYGTLSYLVCDEGGIPRLIHQEQFTNTEGRLLLPLLELFPNYCPYEVLYANFYANGKAHEEQIEQARRHLNEKMEEGTWEQEIRPVRGALSRARIKIHAFGIDISAILATGYILMRVVEPEERSNDSKDSGAFTSSGHPLYDRMDLH